MNGELALKLVEFGSAGVVALCFIMAMRYGFLMWMEKQRLAPLPRNGRYTSSGEQSIEFWQGKLDIQTKEIERLSEKTDDLIVVIREILKTYLGPESASAIRQKQMIRGMESLLESTGRKVQKPDDSP